jgi:hypothetical protein
MSNRDFGVSALGRFLAVERYRESKPSSFPAYPPRTPAGRTGGYAGTPDSRTAAPAPGRPQHG